MSIPQPELTYYVQPADVRNAAAPTSNTAGTAAELTETQLYEVIEEAQGTINGYVGSRYALPFKMPYPKMLVSLTTAVALYLATLTYRRNKPMDPNDPVSLRYKHSLSILQGIQAGKVLLVSDTGGEIETEGAQTPADSGSATVANPYEGNLFGFEVSEVMLRPSQRWPR